MPPRLLVLLRWPCRPLLRLRNSLRLRVGLRLPPPSGFWQLRCLVRCRSPRGPQPVAPRHLRSLSVRRSTLGHSLTCFPGFSSIDAGMYVQVAALRHRLPPLSAVLPSVGGRCAIAVARLPRGPRLGPSWRRLRPPTQCYCTRSLCFFWLFVLCVSQLKMSRRVVLYGHMK